MAKAKTRVKLAKRIVPGLSADTARSGFLGTSMATASPLGITTTLAEDLQRREMIAETKLRGMVEPVGPTTMIDEDGNMTSDDGKKILRYKVKKRK